MFHPFLLDNKIDWRRQRWSMCRHKNAWQRLHVPLRSHFNATSAHAMVIHPLHVTSQRFSYFFLQVCPSKEVHEAEGFRDPLWRASPINGSSGTERPTTARSLCGLKFLFSPCSQISIWYWFCFLFRPNADCSVNFSIIHFQMSALNAGGYTW